MLLEATGSESKDTSVNHVLSGVSYQFWEFVLLMSQMLDLDTLGWL